MDMTEGLEEAKRVRGRFTLGERRASPQALRELGPAGVVRILRRYAAGDWPGGLAAVNAAQRLLAGPTVTVPRAVLLQLGVLLYEAVRLIEQALQEGSMQIQQPPDDDQAGG